MLNEKQKNLFRIKKALKFLLRAEKSPISDLILNYIYNNLFSVIYGISITFTILFIYFYSNSLIVHPSLQFNIQSSFYLFVVSPLIVGIFFIGSVCLFFSPGYLGYGIFKEFEKKLQQYQNGFRRAQKKIFWYFYLPIMLLLLILVLSPKYIYSLPFAFPFLFFILPVIVLAVVCLLLKRDKEIESNSFEFCLFFLPSWICCILIIMVISMFMGMASLHLSNVQKYTGIIISLMAIFLFNFGISCYFEKRTIIERCVLFVFLGLIIFLVIDINFNDHNKVLHGIARLAGIRKDKIQMVVTQEDCNIIKIQAPMVIKDERYGLCKTFPVNILFNIGEHCLVDPLQKNVQPFSIPCEGIKS